MGTTIEATRDQTDVPIGVHVTRDGGITGLTVVARIFNGANLSQFLDFNDDTFKDAGHTTPTLALTEEQATTNPGYYAVDGGFDLSPLSLAAIGSLHVRYEITAGGETGDDVDVIEFVSGGDVLDAVALAETEVAAAAREVTNTGEHAATLAAVLLTETEASAAARHAAILAVLTSTGVVLTGPAITAIWDEDVTGREASPNTAARIVDMQNKLMRGRLRTNPAANQLELYDPVDDTVLLTWPLTDFAGNPIANAIGAPFDRAKAVET